MSLIVLAVTAFPPVFLSFLLYHRYIMQWPGGRILQRHELDAFLAQAVSNQLYEPDQLQELKVLPSSCHIIKAPGRDADAQFLPFFIRQVEKVDARGVQLASLFMAGVDTALFINDVCGQPLPWEHCCPWGFFDGKLFQSKLARAARDRSALLDMCEGQVRLGWCAFMVLRLRILKGRRWKHIEKHWLHQYSLLRFSAFEGFAATNISSLQEELVSKVEKMRQAILEGINLSRPPPPPPPLPPPAFLPPTMVPPFYPMPPLYPPRPMGGMPPHHHPHHPHHPAQHRPRAFPGLLVTHSLFFMILWPHLTVISTQYLRELKSFNINSGLSASGISGSLREHSFFF